MFDVRYTAIYCKSVLHHLKRASVLRMFAMGWGFLTIVSFDFFILSTSGIWNFQKQRITIHSLPHGAVYKMRSSCLFKVVSHISRVAWQVFIVSNLFTNVDVREQPA